MQAVGNSSGFFGSTSDRFVAGASGVAALDTPQLSQTKLEIRNIVAEIAEFSAGQLPQSEFLDAVLPRICNAMGATAAALWHCDLDSHCTLMGQYRLPEVLKPAESNTAESAAAQQRNHARILACVAAEGTGVLVPPHSVKMTADRPINPLEECLLVVPVKIDDRYEMLLEVIQPPGGGPAAQRGYLRFVAQVADLMSDYLRRQRLHDYARRAAYVERLQSSLIAISSTTSETERLQKSASALADLLDAELVMLADPKRILGWRAGWRVRAISHVSTFDSRSEIVLATERLLVDAARHRPDAPRLTLLATADLTQEDTNESLSTTPGARIARGAEQLRELLNCSHVGLLTLGPVGDVHALIALDAACDLSTTQSRAAELAESIGSMLQAPTRLSPFHYPSASIRRGSTAPLRRLRWERILVRVSMLLLVLAIAFFPTPDNIATVAVLEPADKEIYYSPGSAIVDEVFVDTHQTVKKGERMIKLADSQLEARYDELQGQKRRTLSQLKHEQGQLKLRARSREDEHQLSANTVQLDIDLAAIEDQLRIVEKQVEALTIVARRDATVTTWDVRNQLRGRPVIPGQLLLTTYQPQAPWQLRVSVPERQLGQLRSAMAKTRDGLPVQFALSSHPSEVRLGRLVRLSDQLFKDENGSAKAIGMVAIDASHLPALTDGAVARATIACGRSYAGWLAIRDAYREASAWWRLNW